MRDMKDSGIDWIGEIPEDWNISRFKYLLSMPMQYGATESGIEYEESLPRYIRITDITLDGKLKQENKLSLSEDAARKYILKDNALLFARSGASVGKTFLYKEKYGRAAFAGYLISAYTNDKIYPEWAYYYTLSNAYWNWTNQIFSQATIQNIGADKYENMPMTYPNVQEQRKIISFLDKKCAEIDSLQADIQTEIDTLDQYKRSVISEAVTKGLDRNVEMKDSGNQYWREIPATWHLSDIKYLFEIKKRIAGKEGYDVLSVTQKGVKVKDTSKNEGQLASDYSNYQFLYPGEFVMNHMDLLTGGVDLSDRFGVTSPDYRVFCLRNTERNCKRYYKYVMQTCYLCRIFYSLGNGVSNLGRWRLQTFAFNNFEIPVPSNREQEEIADYLDGIIEEIGKTVELKQQQLETLAQYKKSLIYEYVTGKKEVPCE